MLHAMDMRTAPKREFIDYFENEIIRPRGLDYKIQFVGPTGTNAVEAAPEARPQGQKAHERLCADG